MNNNSKTLEQYALSVQKWKRIELEKLLKERFGEKSKETILAQMLLAYVYVHKFVTPLK